MFAEPMVSRNASVAHRVRVGAVRSWGHLRGHQRVGTGEEVQGCNERTCVHGWRRGSAVGPGLSVPPRNCVEASGSMAWLSPSGPRPMGERVLTSSRMDKRDYPSRPRREGGMRHGGDAPTASTIVGGCILAPHVATRVAGASPRDVDLCPGAHRHVAESMSVRPGLRRSGDKTLGRESAGACVGRWSLTAGGCIRSPRE